MYWQLSFQRSGFSKFFQSQRWIFMNPGEKNSLFTRCQFHWSLLLGQSGRPFGLFTHHATIGGPGSLIDLRIPPDCLREDLCEVRILVLLIGTSIDEAFPTYLSLWLEVRLLTPFYGPGVALCSYKKPKIWEMALVRALRHGVISKPQGWGFRWAAVQDGSIKVELLESADINPPTSI